MQKICSFQRVARDAPTRPSLLRLSLRPPSPQNLDLRRSVCKHDEVYRDSHAGEAAKARQMACLRVSASGIDRLFEQ